MSDVPGLSSLASFLRDCPPLGALHGAELEAAASMAREESLGAGEVVLDGFGEPTDDLVAVRSGTVDLWNDPFLDAPDETVGPGGIFGFSAILTGRAIGPRAVAATDVDVVRVPREAVAAAFASAEGARFLVEAAARTRTTAPAQLLGALIRKPPLVVEGDQPANAVSRLMTEAGASAAVVRLPDAGFGLLTDAVLRREIATGDHPLETPAAELAALAGAPLVLPASATTTEAIISVVEDGREAVLVMADGGPRGVVTGVDFLAATALPGLALHEQVRRAPDIPTLVRCGLTLPAQLADLLERGVAPSRAIALHSAVIDAAVRRTLQLVLQSHPQLTTDAFAWLALGSTGRREAVLSSDMDAAVVFADWVSGTQQERYRSAFAEVTGVLASAGLSSDEHGVSPVSPLFARTEGEWRRAAAGWLADPLKDKGAIMTSLLADSRPIHGDPALPAVTRVLRTVRQHRGTLRLLLDQTLAHRARQRTGWSRLRRAMSFDVKTYALLPIVNLARWSALAVGSHEVGTVARLRSGVGSEILPPEQGLVLAEVFDVLQGMRLKAQVRQISAGQIPTDWLETDHLSPIDRSVLHRAVREIQAAQRRAQNIARVVPAEEWIS